MVARERSDEHLTHIARQGDSVNKQFDHNRGVSRAGEDAGIGDPSAPGTTASTIVDRQGDELTRRAA
jgi:hypothetical protein